MFCQLFFGIFIKNVKTVKLYAKFSDAAGSVEKMDEI